VGKPGKAWMDATHHFLQNMKAIFFLESDDASSIWLSMGEDIANNGVM
jgi:hypothetical protein